jgi:hypothetical protein
MTSDKLKQRQAGVVATGKARAENPQSSPSRVGQRPIRRAKLARNKVGDASVEMAVVQASLEQTADGTPASSAEQTPSYVQQAATHQAQILEAAGQQPKIKGYIQLISSIGAILGCLIAPLVGGRLGRRPSLVCLFSLLACGILFGLFRDYSTLFLAMVFPVGFFTAAFYGWLPLYLPELFPTVRATGQGLFIGRRSAPGRWGADGILRQTLRQSRHDRHAGLPRAWP